MKLKYFRIDGLNKVDLIPVPDPSSRELFPKITFDFGVYEILTILTQFFFKIGYRLQAICFPETNQHKF